MGRLSKARRVQILDQVEKYLNSKAEIKIALVYGSFASEEAMDTSDLDIAIATHQPLTDDQKVDLANSIGKAAGREVDLIDLWVATGVVLQEALTRGQFLKQVDDLLLARILKRMWFNYEDFERQRERILAERRKRVFGG